MNSLPFKVTILDNSTSCHQNPACARINAQNQVYDLALNSVPVALQVYCLTHLQSLYIFGYYTEGYSWPIPYEIKTLTKLTYLSISFVDGDIPETIGELKLLRTLYLLGLSITHLTGGLAALPNLSDLTIHAPLVELPSFLSILPLQNLGIINAQFTTIPDDFFRNLNPTLLSLTIDISHLVNLDPFADLTKLATFFVYVYNGLSVFPWQFTYMTNLKDLRFQGVTCLSTLPQNFTRTVTYLALYNNCFREIPTPLLLSKALTSLDMSYNQISDLSSLALSRSPLSVVFLTFNQIQYIPPEIINLSDSLTYLGLQSNRLTTLPAEEMVKMKKLTGLGVEFNNINDTEIARLKSIFAANPISYSLVLSVSFTMMIFLLLIVT